MDAYNIKRIIRTSFIGRSKVYLFLRWLSYRKGQDAIIYKFLGKSISDERKRQVKKMMKRAFINYRWEFDEFFLFNFEKIDEKKKKSFVPEYDKNIFTDLINSRKEADVFLDKWTTYEYFKKYFRRDVYNIRSLEDLFKEEFHAFINAHPKFMMKPVYGTRGAGIKVIEVINVQDAVKQLSALYNSGIKDIIIEELIQQDSVLSAFHESSCNTIRIVTLRYDDRVDVIHSFWRVGQGDSVVDNAGAGGIMGNIDIKTGTIYAACDESGKSYTRHPESKLPIVGFTLPRWQEAINTAKQLAQILPNVRYVGWDLALCDKGWVMIEGNDKGQFVFQYPAQEGCREEMNTILRELKKKEIW